MTAQNKDSIRSKESSECKSGFHDPHFELTKLQIAIENRITVTLCDFCFCRIMDARRNNEDLTMHVLYFWAQELDYIPTIPNSIEKNGFRVANLVKFINDLLAKVRDKEKEDYKLTESAFPTVRLDPESKKNFMRVLEEDKTTIQRI